MITIQSKYHPYTVEVAESLGGAIAKVAETSKIFVIVDANIERLYPEAFEGLSAPRFSIEATEEAKSYEALMPLFCQLLEAGFKKDATLLVIGGGVVQDIGCFISSVLFRGIRWELIPTTLLAQCDSCIGSKSSINIGNFKNQIGTFYPPHRVHMVYDLLKTLPHDEIRSGLGEIIKLHLLAGEKAYEEMLAPLAAQDLPKLILSSLKIKQAYIEQDELDRGIRNLLNYGHTFGHAYESATHYAIPHGIAVSLGVATATYISERLGMTEKGHFEHVNQLLRPYYQPFHQELGKMSAETALNAMRFDKKNTGNRINAILTRGLGKMEKVPLALEELQPLVKDFIEVLNRA